jgi:ceramide glucosyltransferase
MFFSGAAMAWVNNLPLNLYRASAFTLVRYAILALAAGPLLYYLTGIYSAWRFFRVAHHSPEPPADGSELPPVSVLKPLRGLDPDAYENFASFCRQDYPDFEILFAVADASDPVVPVVRKLVADFPGRSIRLVVALEQLGPNSKVSSLCRLAREARHALLVITDSDVRVEPGYLRRVASMFRDPEVGGVTALYRGCDNLPLVAAMDCVSSSAGFCGAALVAREIQGVQFMMGSTMAMTKQRLIEIGGFEALVDLHSDDYELGRRIADRGYKIELLPEPVWMTFPSQSLGAYLRHELRWAIGIRNIRPGGHFGMLFTHGLPWAVAACLIAPDAAIATAYLAAYLILRFAMAWMVGGWGLRDPVLRRRIWLLPVCDLLSFFVWLASFSTSRIEWRGSYFILKKGRMVPMGRRSSGSFPAAENRN